jgi:hypothetical protein
MLINLVIAVGMPTAHAFASKLLDEPRLLAGPGYRGKVHQWLAGHGWTGLTTLNVHNEWCDLKEVIIGGGDNLFPTGDAPGAKESLWILPGKDALDAAKCLGKSNWHCCKDTKQGDRLVSRICPPVDLEKRPCCTWQGVEDEANHFAKKVEELGIKVHRTDWLDVENLERNFGEKPVAAAGAMAIFPRDPMQVVGDALIELRLGAANRRAEIFDVLKYIDGPNGIQANPANTVISMPERSYASRSWFNMISARLTYDGGRFFS